MSLSDDGGKVVRSSEDRDIKKVRFKGGNGETSVDMVVDVVPTLPPSWKDKLLGGASSGSNKRSSDSDDEIDGGTVILKLLGRSIGYATLHDRISSL
ncbi:hypothetical protein Gotur_000759 [Gossypium turneri]